MAGSAKYTDDSRRRAVDLAAANGLADASRELGIPKSTIKTWATKAGVNVADEKLQAQVERATTMSVAVRRQRVAEAKERITVLLAAIAELGARAQIDMLKAGQFSLAEAVGATTRAIHDLQLLEGNPTEISEEIDVADLVRLRNELQDRVERETR